MTASEISIQVGRESGHLARPLARRPVILNYGFSGEVEDGKACSAAIRRGSKSFHLASLMLPSPTRQAARALYAFCRHSDDLIDAPRSGLPALERLRQRLDQIYAGDPAPFACDRAFARAVEEHGIPKPVVEALLDGFAMDLEGRRYQTLDELKSYATCVAASVGLMMAAVMGVSDRSALARAADLGLAMQLTNIARDVGEDARNGRLYLPLDWLSQHGIDPDAFLGVPGFSPALGEVVKKLLHEADRHYRLGHAGIASLPPACQHAIRTAALVYEEIGTAIAANGYDSITHRARTTLARKLSLLVKARRPDCHLANGGQVSMQSPADPASARLVSLASAAAATIAPRASAEQIEGTAGRLTAILLRLQTQAREERDLRRLAAREKAASLA
ncbi:MULTISPECIES: phytoene/squalene synthase family protein [unclassified Rhizobium]|uniref:phytoene/squalene synthase family protein n=1 Tax=unclassified Rhizobium TaxID=2613769 RepID=UPI0009E97146|nr:MULTISPECIES: phytoene/squalene synthase family protein [unclassified Rhizobium]